MLDTEGFLTVEQAAKRLSRSAEQVRRYLREGKLKGRHIGNQWFIEEAALARFERPSRGLIAKDLLDRIDRSRQEIFRRNGIFFDAVEVLRSERESH